MPKDDKTPKRERREHATLRNDRIDEAAPARLVVLTGGPVGRRYAVAEDET
ncbi:MAG: hypothetical protein JRI68_27675, partial [Deltaproteobacteria bacterium]|nr:hypothetical protein [Deltaproteobacteria bacterium]